MTATSDGYDVLVVGSGHAGAQTAIHLRQHGFTGSIAMVTADDELPYERPPLSKDYLLGTTTFERLLLRPEQFWAQREVTIHRGRHVLAVDPMTRTVRTDDGGTLRYGRLVWAAGGRARTLSCPGHELAGVHSMRSRVDSDRITAGLHDTGSVAIVGGGYIGLEVAAAARSLGKSVTVLEAQERVLSRVAGPVLSRFYEAEHRAHDVDLRLGAGVVGIEGSEGRVIGVRLADGGLVPAGVVVVGVGIVPVVEPLQAAGAVCDNGVLVDAYARTSLPDVFAVGDCARHPNRFAGGALTRLESVQNANDMALTVTRTILGTPEPYTALPWFWSNQYDLRLQSVGLATGYDEQVVEGDPRDRSFSVSYRRAGELLAVDCVNATKSFVRARALLGGTRSAAGHAQATGRSPASAARTSGPTTAAPVG